MSSMYHDDESTPYDSPKRTAGTSKPNSKHQFKQWCKKNLWWLLTLILIACLFLPTNYIIEMPGPTMNVLGNEILNTDGTKVIAAHKEAITISNATVHPTTGKLLMVTVNVAGAPGYPIPVWQVLTSWFNSRRSVLPREVVFPIGSTTETEDKTVDQEMNGAQSTAKSQALQFIQKHHLTTQDLKKVSITMGAGDVGGPSAGMMFTLGTIDKLTTGTLAGNQTIAGTGTISNTGTIGKIGGIRMKMIGARDDGASWFLAPAGNCADVVGHIPSGLHVVRVSTLDEAYHAVMMIGKGQGNTLPTCSVG